MLSRMHYQGIGDAIATVADRRWGDRGETSYTDDGDGMQALAEVAGELCAYFLADNPSFDRRRFLERCSLTEQMVRDAEASPREHFAAS